MVSPKLFWHLKPHYLTSPGFSHLQVRKDLRVIVQDKNDNAPVFQNSAYATSINEVSPVFVGRGIQGTTQWSLCLGRP